MSTFYPTGIDTFTTKTDGITDVLASHVNNLQDSVVAIENVVGRSGNYNFASSGNYTYTASAPLAVTQNNISIVSGSSDSNGFISSGDWASFDDRQRSAGFYTWASPTSSASIASAGASLTTLGSLTAPVFDEKGGYGLNFQTATTPSGTTAGIQGGLSAFARSSGNAFLHNGGFNARFRIFLPDLLYSGANGCRIFVGLSSSSSNAAIIGTDNPAGNYAGFQFCAASGIAFGGTSPRQDTKWTFMTKDNVTQNYQSGVIFYPQCTYDMKFKTRGRNQDIDWYIKNITSGTETYGTTSSCLPLNTVGMRPYLLIAMWGASGVARNIRFSSFHVEQEY